MGICMGSQVTTLGRKEQGVTRRISLRLDSGNLKGKLGWEEEFLELAEAVFGQGGRRIIYREAKATGDVQG